MASLAKNTAFLTVASILQKAVAFLYFAAIARMIGAADTGSYFLALTLVTTVGVLTDLGLSSVLIRDSARSPDSIVPLVRRMIGLKLVAAPLAIAAAIILPKLLGYDAETSFLILVAIPVMLADSVSLTMYGALRGVQELRYESLGIFLGQVFTTIAGIAVLLLADKSLPMLVFALLAGSGWNALYSVYQITKRFGVRSLVPDFHHTKPLLIAAFPFFLAAVFVKIYSFFDSYILGVVLGASAVGLYSVAYKLTFAFQFLPLAFIGALYPKMSSLAEKPVELKRVFLDAQWYLALLVSPIAFGIFALAPEIVDLVYGGQYAESVLPLSVVIFVLIPIFFDFPIGSLLNASGRQNVKTAIMGVTMVVNFIANVVFIQWHGIVGAALAACVSFVVMFGLGAYMVQKQIAITLRDWLRSVGGLLFAGAVMACVILLLKPLVPDGETGMLRLSWLALIPIGALVYCATAYVTRALSAEHVRQVVALFRKPSYGTPPVANE